MTQEKKRERELLPISSPAGKVLDVVLNASRDKSREFANLTRYQAALLPLLDTLHAATRKMIDICDYRMAKRNAQHDRYVKSKEAAITAYNAAVKVAQDTRDTSIKDENSILESDLLQLQIVRPKWWDSRGQKENDKMRIEAKREAAQRIELAELTFDKEVNTASLVYLKACHSARNQSVELKMKVDGKTIKRPIPEPADLTDELVFRIVQYSKSIGGMTLRNATDLAVSEVESQAMKMEDDMLKNLDKNYP